ncbi:MAG: YdeI family protein [Bauldia sp.]
MAARVPGRAAMRTSSMPTSKKSTKTNASVPPKMIRSGPAVPAPLSGGSGVRPLDLPSDVVDALSGGTAAAFASLPPSHRREYLLWIGEAKRPATRARRIADMISRLGPPERNEHDGKA